MRARTARNPADFVARPAAPSRWVGCVLVALAAWCVGHAAHAGPIFTMENVARGCNSRLCLVVDPQGVTHSLLIDNAPNARVQYGTLMDGLWTFETVYAIENWGITPYSQSLAFDSMSHPYVVYQTRESATSVYRLFCAYWDGLTWQSEAVDSLGKPGSYASIGVDRGGQPHIAYSAVGTSDLRYASRSGGAWMVETLGSRESGRYATLALDSLDTPHISYYKDATGELRYATKTLGEWVMEDVDISLNVMTCGSLALDSTGTPRVSYYDCARPALKYAVRSGGGWTVTLVDSSPGMTWPSLALDSLDRPRIAYTDTAQQDLRYAEYDGSSWHIQIPDSHGRTGGAPKLVLEPDGDPQILYLNYDGESPPEVWFAHVAPPGMGTIAGVVQQNCDGAVVPMSGVRVVLQRGGDPQDSTLTDEVGGYSFAGIPLGAYLLVVRSTIDYQAVPPDSVVILESENQVINVAMGMACRTFSIPCDISNSASNSQDPAVVRDEDGNLLVAWGSGTGQVVHARSEDDGATWSRSRPIPGLGFQPALALGDSSRIYELSGSSDSLCLKQSGDGGVQMDPTQTTVALGLAASPDVTTATGTCVHALWGGEEALVGERVCCASSSDGGATFSSPLCVDVDHNYGYTHFSSLRVLAAASDSVYLLWLRYVVNFGGADTAQVMFSRSLDDGLTFSTPRAISESVEAVRTLDAQIDSNGTIHVVWYGGGGATDISYLRSTDGGTTFERISGIPNSDVWTALNGQSLAVGSGGELHLLTFGRFTGTSSSLYYTHSADGGATWDPLYLVVPYFGDIHQARMILDRVGTPVIVLSSTNAGAREIWFTRKMR